MSSTHGLVLCDLRSTIFAGRYIPQLIAKTSVTEFLCAAKELKTALRGKRSNGKLHRTIVNVTQR